MLAIDVPTLAIDVPTLAIDVPTQPSELYRVYLNRLSIIGMRLKSYSILGSYI